MNDPKELVLDTSKMSNVDLVRWAKARIDRDMRELSDQLRAIGVLDEDHPNFGAGVHFDMAVVVVCDKATGACYVPGPISSLVGQTADGRELLWRDGEAIYDLANPGAFVAD